MSRASSREAATGAVAQGWDGRRVPLTHGGAPLLAAARLGRLRQVQCAEFARAAHGRGARRWEDYGTTPQLRVRLLREVGAVARVLRAELHVAIDIPARGGRPPHPGARRVGAAGVLRAGGGGAELDVIWDDIGASRVDPLGARQGSEGGG